MKTRTRAAVLAQVLLALVLLAVLAGCGLGRLPVGPLGKQQENYTVVGQPVREGGADTISDEVVFNDLLFPAVIDRLVVVSPRHIKLIGAYMTIGGIIGNWVTFPRPSPPPLRAGATTGTRSGCGPTATRSPGPLFLHADRLESCWALKRQALMAASRRSTCSTTSAGLITNGAAACGQS
jgi:hypothetical protein